MACCFHAPMHLAEQAGAGEGPPTSLAACRCRPPGSSESHDACNLPAGNWMTATGLVICAVIGAGVLGLPYALAVLG